MKTRKLTVFASLLLFGAAGCADLEVANPGAADRERALATGGDVESLIAGSFGSFMNPTRFFDGPAPFLSTAAFQHSAWPANFGMVFYSAIPRGPIVNDPARDFYGEVAYTWTHNYRALAAAAMGLRSIDAGDVELSASAEARARALAKFVQGLAHGTIALLYDQGPIMDESVEIDPVTEQPVITAADFVSYSQLMDAALGYLDEAITHASANSFSSPSAWTINEMSNTQMVGYAHAIKAQFRAMVARNLEERGQAARWQAILADLADATPWNIRYTTTHGNHAWRYSNLFLWSQMTYWIDGMADTEGDFERWFNAPLGEKHPQLDGQDVVIITPDQRFPRGSTIAEQQLPENRGTQIIVPNPDIDAGGSPAGQWGQPGRGTWRWSFYKWTEGRPYFDHHDRYNNGAAFGPIPMVSEAELRLLEAEANYWLGNHAAAAAIINETREAAGLVGTNALGLNVDCVPRVPPNFECGDLLEMLKWEHRQEARFTGVLNANWFFHSRGWGDLMQHTPIHFPVPAREAELDDITPYWLGGPDFPDGAPVSTYGY